MAVFLFYTRCIATYLLQGYYLYILLDNQTNY